MANSEVLKLKNIQKSFIQGKQELKIISDSSLVIKKGEIVALVGPSGSGKTTILQIAGLLDVPNSGEIFINNINATKANDEKRTSIRRDCIGFVYQFHHLLPEFSALENVMMKLLIKGTPKKEAEIRAKSILNDVGLLERIDHRPSQLSGGEQQRVAIARAAIDRPSIILADEPTGNLDPENSQKVFKVLLEVIKENNLSLLIVTHNQKLASKADRVLTIKKGELVEQ